MSHKSISIIIPARNEEALIMSTVRAALESVKSLMAPQDRREGLPDLRDTEVEIIVVDNASTDQTARVVQRYVEENGVTLLNCGEVKAPIARNLGASVATGRILVFVDADTMMPPDTLSRVMWLCDGEGYQGGFTRLASLEGGMRAWAWWMFWEHVRALPIARAKAMSALMFCTRAVFEEFGGFNADVTLGEEWSILGGLYGARPDRFVYDRTLTAMTSSRRMELQRFGYARTLAQYVLAVVHPNAKIQYSDRIREAA